MAAWAQIGGLVLAAAGALWLLGALVYESSFLTLLAMTLIAAAGVLIAARSRRYPRRVSKGMVFGSALAFLGMLAFFFDVFVPLRGFGPGLFAVVLFLGGYALATLALLRRRSTDSAAWLHVATAGFALAAVPGFIWLYADASPGAYWWQPGNLASAVAAALLAFGTRSRPPEAAPAPRTTPTA